MVNLEERKKTLEEEIGRLGANVAKLQKMLQETSKAVVEKRAQLALVVEMLEPEKPKEN